MAIKQREDPYDLPYRSSVVGSKRKLESGCASLDMNPSPSGRVGAAESEQAPASEAGSERVSTSEAGPEQAATLATGFERDLPAIGLGQAATSLPGSQDQQSGPILQPCKQPLTTTQKTPQGTVGRNTPIVEAGKSHSDRPHVKLRQQTLHFFAAQPLAKNSCKTAVYGGFGTALAVTGSGQAAVSAAEAEPAVTSAAESEHATASVAESEHATASAAG